MPGHEPVLLKCAVDRGVILEGLDGVGGSAESVGHVCGIWEGLKRE